MSSSLNVDFDLAVIGAGPAGLCAAHQFLIKQPGAKVALFDRQPPWTEPVACAEAVHRAGFEQYAPTINPSWIRGDINGTLFIAPDGTPVDFEYQKCGYFVNRAQMHHDWSDRCIELGAQVFYQHTVRTVSAFQKGIRTLTISSNKTSYDVSASIVIDASGAASRFGENEGLATGFFDREPALFEVLEGIDFPKDRIQLWYGQEYAPGGYAWVFPQGEGVANVGLVISKDYAKTHPPRVLLDNLIKNYFPQGKSLLRKGGAISCGGHQLPLVANRLIKVGDSASMVHPLSRGGIVEAMQAGVLAGNLVFKLSNNSINNSSINNSTHDAALYKEFEEIWFQKKGKHLLKVARAKEEFGKISDATFNRAARNLTNQPNEKRTLPRIFWATLRANPCFFGSFGECIYRGGGVNGTPIFTLSSKFSILF
jgi:digeranylgeranylglycerophospholipid reductase